MAVVATEGYCYTQRTSPAQSMLPTETSEYLAHARQLGAYREGVTPAIAAGATRQVLAAVLRARYPRLLDLGVLEEPVQSEKSSRSLAAFAVWLERQPFAELAFWLSSAYAGLLRPSARRKQALFFTPPSLSTRLLASLRVHGVRFSEARFADPSCGGSAFLAPIAIEVAQELTAAKWSSGRILAHVESHVVGFELDPFLCELSHIFLNMALYPHVARAGRLLKPRIVQGDALTTAQGDAERYDAVVSNPPYRKLSASEFANLAASHRQLGQGQPNLYSLFIALSLKLTKSSGHIGLLTPAGFFGGKSFAPLRRLLLRDATVRQVDFIERRKGAFLHVQQETALTVISKRPVAKSSVSVFVTADGQEFTSLGTHSLHRDSTRPWVLPRNVEELHVLRAFDVPQWRLADYGYKPKTGFLVPHRMPLRRLRAIGNRLWACPLIWATQIGASGRHDFKGGRREHADIFVDVSKHGLDQVITTPSVALQRISSKDQANRLKCAAIEEDFVVRHGGYIGENHVTFLVPLEGQRQAVSVQELAAIMNSTPVNQVFRCLSGTATVSAYELRAMPLPNPDVVKRALALGKSADDAVSEGYEAVYSKHLSNPKAA